MTRRLSLAALFGAAAAGQELAPKPASPPSFGAKLPGLKILSLNKPSADEMKPKADSRLAQAGFHRKLKSDALKGGKWEKTPTPLWRMGVRSPGARALRLHLTGVDLGAGKLWLHDGRGGAGRAFGPYSGKGPLGDGEFWSETISGDTAVIEFEPGVKTSALPFQIQGISHMTTE